MCEHFGFCYYPPHYYLNAHNQQFNLNRPLVFLALWVFYIQLHYLFFGGTNTQLIYLTVHFLLVWKASSVFKRNPLNFNFLVVGIIAIAILEAIYCIAQYLGWMVPKNVLFVVTGSWVNPNVTALFLAITTPMFYYTFSKKYKIVSVVGFALVVMALYLLKCRTAFIGTVVAAIVYFSLTCGVIPWVKAYKNRYKLKVVLVLCVLLILPLASSLYTSKKASSDGRLFIWKIATIMIAEKPLVGYGYGLFEKEYNLFQAQYINEGKANAKQLHNAGHVLVAHNEIVQQVVEGGIIGGFLFIAFMATLLFSIKDRDYSIIEKNITTLSKNNLRTSFKRGLTLPNDTLFLDKQMFNLAYAGIVAFCAMALFNFAIQSIPSMTIMSIYTAFIVSKAKPYTPQWFNFKAKKLSWIVTLIFTTVSLYLLYYISGVAIADRQQKKALVQADKGLLVPALSSMYKLAPQLKPYTNYWEYLGNTHFKLKQYKEAAYCFNQAKTTSAGINLYMMTGICYEKLGQFQNAIIEYNQAVLFMPAKFKYRHALMRAYFKNKDKTNALLTAQGILDLKPKIASKEVDYYKKMAQKVLGVTHRNPNKYPKRQFNKTDLQAVPQNVNQAIKITK